MKGQHTMKNPYFTRTERGSGPFGGIHGHRGRPGHGMGGRRLLHRGDLRLLVLKLLEAGPRHGYELIEDVEALAGGAYAPSPGILYPTLALLEDMGAIAAMTDGARKQFTLTETGRTEIAASAAQIAEITTRLESLGKTQSTTETGPVRRAMDNLRQVLAGKASGELLARESQHDIADILDEAARRIERL
jgi:DNA-binding PadR family transcriptional regulator